MRVLVIEDEARLAATLQRGLRRVGMAVDTALDGDSGLAKAIATDYDVVVLDRNLPGLGGDDVCRRLQEERRETRVLMLTAAGTLADRIAGLDLGADDYLSKPFAFDELVARLPALGRRPGAGVPAVLEHGDVVLDPGRRTVTRSGTAMELSAKEFAVLEILLGADGRAVRTEELLERAWDEHADPFTNVVRMTVSKLRRKLGDPPLIETVVGVGYRL